MRRLAPLLLLLAHACEPLPCPAQSYARVERLRTDLRSPAKDATLVLTESASARVELETVASGSQYDATGWRAILWYGPDATPFVGKAFTNSFAGRGKVAWDVPATGVATNGRFRLQVLSAPTAGGDAEEWIRGTLVLRDNPGADFLPLTWDALPWATTNWTADAIAAEALLRIAGDAATGTASTNYADAVSLATGTASTNYADAAVSAYAASVSDVFFRVVETSPGVWQSKLPGE